MTGSDRDNSRRVDDGGIPVLTEVVDRPAAPSLSITGIDENQLAILQTELAARTFDLADQLLHAAFQEMEAVLFEQVSNRLRKELPDLIDTILREHIKTGG